jgi:hypothetical protein
LGNRGGGYSIRGSRFADSRADAIERPRRIASQLAISRSPACLKEFTEARDSSARLPLLIYGGVSQNLERMTLVSSEAIAAPQRENEMPPCERGDRKQRHPVRNHFVAFAVCLMLAVIFTLPGSLSPRSSLLGVPGDNFQHAWFLWHFARSVTHLQNPFYTRLIFYPHRVNLSWSTTDPLAGTLALPLSLLAGPVVSYNLSLILELALAVFFGRLLCLRICRNETAALIGGICFGLSPFLLAHALGHLSLVTAFPIPLYFLALDRLLRRADPSWKDSFLLALALLLTALAHFNYTVFCVMATPVVLMVDAIREGAPLLKRTWKPLCAAATAFLILFSPFLVMLLGNSADMPYPRPLSHVRQFSADLLGFLIPSWNHLLLGRWAHGLDPRLFVAGFEGTVYAGSVILALAWVGFWKGRSTQARWAWQAAILGGVFYLLSLGPAIRIYGRQLEIPGPASLLYHVRFARFVSAPARFQVITALCLAILASMGVAFLLSRFEKVWQRGLLVAGVSAVLLLDLLTVPFPRSSIVDPALPANFFGEAHACRVPSELQKGTIVGFPLIIAPYAMKSMWMQVNDGGRYALVDGYVSYGSARVWKDYYRNPILRSLLSLQGEFSAPVDPDSDRQAEPAVARELNLSAIVVFDSPFQDTANRYLEAVLKRNGQKAGSCTIFDVRQDYTVSETKNRDRTVYPPLN